MIYIQSISNQLTKMKIVTPLLFKIRNNIQLPHCKLILLSKIKVLLVQKECKHQILMLYIQMEQL